CGDRGDPGEAFALDLGVDVHRRRADQRRDDLAEQLLLAADPAVERRAVDADLGGERLHVDALAGEERAPGAAEGVERTGLSAGRAVELASESGVRHRRRSLQHYADLLTRCNRL